MTRYAPLALVALAGCLSLPPPAQTDRPTTAGTAAPSFDLERTGEKPGKATLADVTGPSGSVLIFYRGDW